MGSVLCCSCTLLCQVLGSCQPASNRALKACYLFLLLCVVLLSLCFLFWPFSADLVRLVAGLDCGVSCGGRLVTLLWMSFAGLSLLQVLFVLVCPDGCVFLKICLYVGLFVGSLWLPDSLIQWYVWVANVAYVVFYLLQSVVVVARTYELNEYWDARDSLFHLLGTTTVAWVGTFVCLGLSLWHYFPLAHLELFFLCFTLAQAVVISLISQLPYFENGSLLTSGLTGTYLSYLCLNFMNHVAGDDQRSLWLIITIALEILIAAVLLFWTTSTWSLSEESDISEPLVDKPKEAQENSGEMLAFHLVMLLAALFFTVSLRSLTFISGIDDSFLLWGKFTAQCVASLVFVWTLVAPVLLPEYFQA